jgi:transposase-like protein
MDGTKSTRRKHTQRDYGMGFKLAVVRQVEKGDLTYKQAQREYGIQGRSTVLVWLRKHGELDWRRPSMSIPKVNETPAQKIKRLEKELSDERLKNEILNRMIDLSDRQYGTAIRKKSLSEQSGKSRQKSE